MHIFEESRNGFLISTDKTKLQLPVIHGYLSGSSYWAENIPLHTVQGSIDHSLCFGVYDHEAQIGFARIISDFNTFAYLADVFILPDHRGQGLSKWLMHCITAHPDLQGLRRWMLATRDAHALYLQYGFTPLDRPDRIMQKRDITHY